MFKNVKQQHNDSAVRRGGCTQRPQAPTRKMTTPAPSQRRISTLKVSSLTM